MKGKGNWKSLISLFVLFLFGCAHYYNSSSPSNADFRPSIVLKKNQGKQTEPTPKLLSSQIKYLSLSQSTKSKFQTAKHHKKMISNIGKYWAVIIGVSEYSDSRIPSLRYANRDAKEFYDWLILQDGGCYAPSNVRLLLDKEANYRKIKESLFVWLKQAIEEDVVIIFFAGHGSSESPDSKENLFLLPYDVEYDDIATSGFPMWDIETALKRFIKAKKVVVIADACHSGGIGYTFDIARRSNRSIKVNPISSAFQNLSQIGDGICVISASDDKQFSQESQKWGGGHGVFTYFLLQALKGKADYNQDGSVSLGELIPFVSEKVRRETINSQTPTVAGRFDPALTIAK
ncbi:metacaspase-1 [Candidatus Magnetomoraceae bacterium gMMP-15]